MNEHSNPIDFLLDFAWANGADRFVVNNAKDALKRLKEQNEQLLNIFNYPVAYGMINDRLDLYNLRIQNNTYDDQDKIIPLYSNREEFLNENWKGYHYGKSIK